MAHDDHVHPHDHDHHQPHDHHHPDTVAEHRGVSPASVSAFVVTCSDTRDAKGDGSGAMIRQLLLDAGHSLAGATVVKDDPGEIRAALYAALAAGARAVIFTGGTGLSKRDITIETLAPLFEKTLPGFGELFRMLSFQQVGSAAMLSRASAGVVRGAAVFALPGSPRAVTLAMEKLVLPELGHAVREVLR